MGVGIVFVDGLHFVLFGFAWLGFFLGLCSANLMFCVLSQRTG